MGLPRSSVVKPNPQGSALRSLEIAPTVPAFGPLDLPSYAAPPEPHADPSIAALLERASAAPVRMTWESIAPPADPILDEKRRPHVAERRARLTRVVKIALGACLVVCVAALGVTALSGVPASASPRPISHAAMDRTVPAKSVVPVEKLDDATRGKAVRTTRVGTASVHRKVKIKRR